MASYNVIDLMGADIGAVDTTKVFAPGTRCKARNTTTGNIVECVYMAGVANTEQGSWVNLNYDAGTTAMLTTSTDDGGYPIGVAMGATVANTYGWYAIYGEVEALAAASMAANTQCNTTAAANGVIDDAATVAIEGAYSGDAANGGAEALMYVVLQYPYI